jgi:maltose alpha-D-glucosyltransferase / alpha-amylase
MMRSFDYAAESVLLGLAHRLGHSPGLVREADRATLQPWACAWYRSASQAFVNSYFINMGNSPALPSGDKEKRILLECFLLEKALQEVENEINHRRDWVIVPLRGVVRMLGLDQVNVPTCEPT